MARSNARRAHQPLGAHSFRNGPYDFKPHSRDGLGFDWPLTYEELAPYYDKVERLIGVYGANDGLENTPNSSPGCLLPPPKPRVSDLLIAQRAKKVGIPVVAGTARCSRNRWTTRSPGQASSRESRRTADHCRAHAHSRRVFLGDTLRSGLLDPRHLSVNHSAPAARPRHRQARYPGQRDGARGHARQEASRAVSATLTSSLAGPATLPLVGRARCQRVRNGAHPSQLEELRFANGLANSSGKVGRYLMDTVGSSVDGQIPLLESLPPHNEDGASGGHMYAPWWLYGEQLAGKFGFPRGYHIEFGGGRNMPSLSTGAGIEWLTGGSYGRRFKEDVRRYYGSFVYFDGRGEMIPNENSYCEIDPDVKDRWGIPVLRFHWKWSEHETRQAAHMQSTFAQIIEAMGGRVKGPVLTDGAQAIAPGGSIIHEVGGAIMGADPGQSVTNRWGQTWDVRNLFITDGAVFASNADKNPTLTIMALAWRTADHILDRMKRREL